MPSKNVVKQFEAEKMYHVYNRGVDKRIIFTDERDFAVFLSFLKYALLSSAESSNRNEVDHSLLSNAQRFNLRRLALAEKVELISYCLMPNHFHLLLYQDVPDGITQLMRSISTGYSMYFNKRHKRVGSLFQGVYKASPVSSEAYWWHISRYIHLNPIDLGVDYKTYPYSSFRFLENKHKVHWIKPDRIMANFKDVREYEKFVDDYIPRREELAEIKDFLANSKELTVQG